MTRANPPLLIGLGGKLRSGKDAIADHLVENYGYVKLGMSDPLNAALLVLDPEIRITKPVEIGGVPYLPGDHINYSLFHDTVGYVVAKENPEVRRLLQKLGTDVGRNMIHHNVWVNMAKTTILNNTARKIPTVITAMRFPNELEMLSKLSGLSLWVDRPLGQSEGLQGAHSAAQSMISSHASENSVGESLFDAKIVNDGSLEELYSVTDKIIRTTMNQGINRVKGFSYSSSKPYGKKL